MSRLPLVTSPSSDPHINEIFSEITEKAGTVPAAYRAFAGYPHILQANWNRTKNILGQGALPIETKEAIATRVSFVNGCHFCLHIHKANLAQLHFSTEEITDIESGHVADPQLEATLSFVAIATKTPEQLTDNHFTQLKELGYTEQDILEILTVMEMYTGYNKIIIALNLQIDD